MSGFTLRAANGIEAIFASAKDSKMASAEAKGIIIACPFIFQLFCFWMAHFPTLESEASVTGAVSVISVSELQSLLYAHAVCHSSNDGVLIESPSQIQL